MVKKNIGVEKNMDNVEIETFSAVWDDQKKVIVLYDGMTDGFYSLDCETGKLHIMAFLYGEKKQWGHFAIPIRIEEGYCFSPCNGEKMIIINEKGIVETIPVGFDKEKAWRISNALEYEGRILMLCATANGIISIDRREKKEHIIDEWLKEYRIRADKDIYKCGKTRYGNYLLENNKLTIPLLWVSSLLNIDLETEEYSFLDVDSQYTYGFLAIYSVNGYKLLLSAENNQIIEIGQAEIIKAYHCELLGDTFGRSVLIGNKILILGRYTYQMVVYDTISKRSNVHEIIVEDNMRRTAGEANFSVLLTISEAHVVAFDVSTRSFFNIKTDDEWNSIHVKIMALLWDGETRIRLAKEGRGTQNLFTEGKNGGLNFYINVIQKM